MNLKFSHIMFFIVLLTMGLSSSRVAFSRPNLVYKTPGSYFPDLGGGKISLGFTSEIIDVEIPSTSSSAFVMSKINNWNVGLSYTLLPDYRSINEVNASALTESPYEIGMHFQRRICFQPIRLPLIQLVG